MEVVVVEDMVAAAVAVAAAMAGARADIRRPAALIVST